MRRFDRKYYFRHMTADQIKRRIAEVTTRLEFSDTQMDRFTVQELRAALAMIEETAK
jgi:hypothetical protein